LSRRLSVGAELFQADGFFIGVSRAGHDVLVLFLGEPLDDLLRRNRRGSSRHGFRSEAADVVFGRRCKRPLLGSLGTALRTRGEKYAYKKGSTQWEPGMAGSEMELGQAHKK